MAEPPIIFGENADTRVPPDVQPRTRVVAVCGVADNSNMDASPNEDGWLISDFYLWKNVLKGKQCYDLSYKLFRSILRDLSRYGQDANLDDLRRSCTPYREIW